MPNLRRTKKDQAGGSIAFGAVSASFQAVVAMKLATGAYILNSLDTESVLSLDGSTTWGILPAETSIIIPFGQIGLEFTGSIYMKHNGAAPTVGTISVCPLSPVM